MKESKDLFSGSAGTHHFMAPEVCKRLKPEGYSGSKADVWSLGCCLYSLAYKLPPFTGENLLQVFENINKGK